MLVKTTSGILQAGFIDTSKEKIKEKLLSSTAALAGNGVIAGKHHPDSESCMPLTRPESMMGAKQSINTKTKLPRMSKGSKCFLEWNNSSN